MQVLGVAAIEELLPINDCVEVVADAMRAISRGQVLAPHRTMMALTPPNAMGIMPGAMPSQGRFGIKVLGLFPGNGARGLPSHAGAVLLFDGQTGGPVAVLESDMLTALRTAAASAVATRALARPDGTVLALLGAGYQALWHVRALRGVMPLRRLQVWSRSRASAQRLVDTLALPDDVLVVIADSAQAAVAGADVVCTVSASREPILHGDWLVPGQHVNLVGASVASAREADNVVVQRSRFYVDAKDSAAVQAGEWIEAQRAGVVDAGHLRGEIGEVLLGQVQGRIGADDITVYKSLGHTAQDLATADALVQRARASGRYPELPW
ncbi:MAG: ornithine cyclodeaminase family protein [Leptospiraceae bacterium]|nr:ornithine cyclodeaminase family protein [Leptospiraceae bacterium]